jgi:hypothetical protein
MSENELRRELASAAELIDPQPPTRAELQALARRRRGLLRTVSPPLLVAAAVAAVAAVSVAVATQHSSQPRPPATTGPDPVPTVLSTPPAPRPSTSHPVVPPTRPSSKPSSHPSTSGSDSGSSSHSAPPPIGLPLVPGAYGFLVPDGWHEHPLANYGGSGSWASYTKGTTLPPFDGAAGNAVQYAVSAAQGTLYDGSGRPILSEAVNATMCAPTHWQSISASAISFTCVPVDGMTPRGVLIVRTPPGRPGGTKQLVITLPADQQSTATQILDSFH